MADYAAFFTDAPLEAAETTQQDEPRRYRLLFVDDEPNVLKALQRVFRQEIYQIDLAFSAREALAQLESTSYQLVISDYMMPGMDGAAFLRTVKERHPEMIRIMLTGHADTGAVMGAIKEGAVYKFILKPWNDDDLRITVALALEQYDLIQRNKALQTDNQRKSKELVSLARLTATNRSQLVIMLSKRNLLNDQQVQELFKLQQARKRPVLELLLERGWVSENEIRKVLRKDFFIEEVSLAEFQVDPAVAELIPRSLCDRQCILPLKQNGRQLLLAMADPMDMGLVEDIRFMSGMELKVVMADVKAIREKMEQVYGSPSEVLAFQELETMVGSEDPFDAIEIILDEDDDTSLEELLRSTEEPPALRLVNVIVLEAIRLGVSDIHIQPRTKSVVVRYRIDGVLVDKIHIPNTLHRPLVSRIKVMAEMDITERRRPQDGRIAVKSPLKIVDLRISCLPTINGEKVVMRLLDRNSPIHHVQDLGFSQENLNKVLHMISRPQGIILVTGPTGSGKTSTLYALYRHNATPEKNYVTIEDPVEYYLDLAGQVPVREKIGLDFATVLRAILRQDPDVILLGEIRDVETADVAFNAALTGHMVYSTLHTNSAIDSITRLLDLGLKPYIIASALEGIIAQRLVRKICSHCRELVRLDRDVLRRLGSLFGILDVAYRGRGCARCHHSGYAGRIAIHEVLIPDDNLRDLIAGGASLREIRRLMFQEGFITMLEDARSKVIEGLTSVDEVFRILGSQRIM